MDESKKQKPNGMLLRLAISLLLCAVTFGVKHWYPQSVEALRPWIVGRQDNQVSQAFAALGDSMEQGKGLGQAVQAFYAEMSGHEVS